MVARRSGWIAGSLSLALVAAASAVGVAVMNRGLERASIFLTIMSEQPVVMPDGRVLYVQKYEVSVSEWNACHDAGDCTLKLRTRPGFLPDAQPATGLSYVDVLEYLAWIKAETRHGFRLPTADEWTFMAREVVPEESAPIFKDPSLTWASTYLVEGAAPRVLKPQGGYSTSPEGIADLDGSVWEWTQDCYAENIDPDRCPAFYVGGEHVAPMSYLERDPARGGCAVGTPPAHLGVRLVTDSRPTTAGR